MLHDISRCMHNMCVSRDAYIMYVSWSRDACTMLSRDYLSRDVYSMYTYRYACILYDLKTRDACTMYIYPDTINIEMYDYPSQDVCIVYVSWDVTYMIHNSIDMYYTSRHTIRDTIIVRITES